MSAGELETDLLSSENQLGACPAARGRLEVPSGQGRLGVLEVTLRQLQPKGVYKSAETSPDIFP